METKKGTTNLFDSESFLPLGFDLDSFNNLDSGNKNKTKRNETCE